MEKDKKLYMIGNAHIDPVWLWQWQEGYQEVKATFRSVLDRMKEYDDFIFTGSSAVYYKWIEESEPEMFEEIRQRVKEGRWVLVGGWWIQPDCNAPGGESFARQALYGQRYFLEKFGTTAKTGYNVDSFGHNGMLPQLLRKGGMENYVFMRPGRHEKGLEAETFRWQSEDGSYVTASRIPFEYCTWPDEIRSHVLRCAGEIREEGGSLMCFYGVGNHGGGPTKKNLDSIHEMNQEEGMPTLILASPDRFFEDVKKSGKRLPVVSGELLHHSSGCYSAHSEVKRLNRTAENRLEAAEKLSVAASVMSNGHCPTEKYAQAWQNVLFNQFHDIMAGTSLQAAYDDARESYGTALHTAAEGLNEAAQALSWHIDIPMEEGMKPLVVFNPNAFAKKCEVEMESVALKEGMVLLDEEDNEIPFQLVQSMASCNGRVRICFIADLPSLGWRTYRLAVRSSQQVFPPVTSDENSAQNRWLKLTIDPETGYIRSLQKKNDGTEYFSAPAAVPVVIEDKSDTWSHGVRIFNKEVGRFHAVSVKRIACGPVKAVLRVVSEYGGSRIIQDYSVYQELDYVTVKTTVDWHEKWSMLKLQFPMNMNYLRCSYEIPYGVAVREPDGEEYPVQSFFDLEGANPGMTTAINGLSILNDGKCSACTEGKTAALTVLRSPIYAHHEPYVPDEKLEYVYMDQGVQTFTWALYPHDGSWENAETAKNAILLNQKPVALFETYHKGHLKQKDSFLSVSADNVILTVAKLAEDGSGDMVLRLYETAGRHTQTQVELSGLGRSLTLSFAPFEIKTVRVPKDAGQPARETDFLEL